MMPELVRKCRSFLTRICVIGAEQAVIGAAAEDKSTAGGQQRSPHHRARIQGPPNALARIHVQRLDLTVERRLGVDGEVQIRDGDAGPPTVRERALRLYLRACCSGFGTMECKQARSWDCRPRTASPCRPKAGAGLHRSGGRLVRHIDFGRPVSLSMSGQDVFLRHEGLRSADMRCCRRYRASAIARSVRAGLSRPFVVAPFNWKSTGLARPLRPVHDSVLMVLEIAIDLAGIAVSATVDDIYSCSAGPLITDPRRSVAGAPIDRVGVGIVVAGHPRGSAAGFPSVSFLPGIAAGLAGRRNGMGTSTRLAGLCIKSSPEPRAPISPPATPTSTLPLTNGSCSGVS